MHKTSPGRLYCKECGQKAEPSEFKIIKCIDCGEDLVVGKYDTETCRCEECNLIYQRKRNAAKNKAYRERIKNQA
jgi:hypothetical protein